MRVLRKGLTMMATPASDCDFDRDVAVVGGCGHVGPPLAIALADRGARVVIYDVSEEAVAAVNAGRVPFDEPGAGPLSELSASTRPAVVAMTELFSLPQIVSARSASGLKLERVLEFKAGRVLCTDPHVTTDPRLLPQDHVISQGDLLIIAAPHSQYRHLDTAKPVADVWNVAGQGVRV
jgi:UDP-N-acetyl-D-mannosaminuronate dehydrogenase